MCIIKIFFQYDRMTEITKEALCLTKKPNIHILLSISVPSRYGNTLGANMKLSITAFVFWLSLLLGGVAEAQGLSLGLSIPIASGHSSTDVNVRWSQKNESNKRHSGLCVTTATLIYTTASHPTGNRRGILNENTDGYGGRCYTDKNESFYLVVAMLRNSQYGDTFAFGPGVKWRLFETSPKFGSVSLDIGAEIPFVHYEYGRLYGIYLRAQGRAINSPLPMLFVGANWKLGNVEVGMMQMWLPGNAAHLRATVVQGSFDRLPVDNQAFFSREPRIAREPRVGPTVFLQYRF